MIIVIFQTIQYDVYHTVSSAILNLFLRGLYRIDCPHTWQYDRHHHVSSNQPSLGVTLVMPWPKEHKPNTRARIIEAAAAEFRRHGIAQVGVADVMRRAGLTHGGFYAHFNSKEDLLAEALAYASEQVNSMLETPPEDDASAHRLLSAAMTYLSSFHLTHPERACPVASLGPELLRSSQKVRRTLAAEIRSRLKKLHDLTPARVPPETRRQQVAGAFACMVGGLILARGLNESEGLEFLKDCHAFLREALASSAPESLTTRPRRPRTGG
jgi:TetR/AcrR family transcriptional regulator, transcriptional repressor for nem operon